MGTGAKWTFFQRPTGGHQAQEKMFNITNYQENADQNHNELSPHTCQNGYCQKGKKQQVQEKREPSYTVDGNVNWHSHYEKQHSNLSKN